MEYIKAMTIMDILAKRICETVVKTEAIFDEEKLTETLNEIVPKTFGEICEILNIENIEL